MIHEYADENLRKIWACYITIPGWVVFVPANGGRPLIFESVE